MLLLNSGGVGYSIRQTRRQLCVPPTRSAESTRLLAREPQPRFVRASAALALLERDGDADRAQNRPLDLENPLRGEGPTERLRADVLLVKGCDLLALEDRRLRNAALSAPEPHVGRRGRKARRAGDDDDVRREVVADVRRDDENGAKFVEPSQVDEAAAEYSRLDGYGQRRAARPRATRRAASERERDRDSSSVRSSPRSER